MERQLECCDGLLAFCSADWRGLADDAEHGTACRIWTELWAGMVRRYVRAGTHIFLSDSRNTEHHSGELVLSRHLHARSRTADLHLPPNSIQWQLSTAEWDQFVNASIDNADSDSGCMEPN